MDKTDVRFISYEQVLQAAYFWYKSFHLDHCCLAENRLMRGELPPFPSKYLEREFFGATE